MSSHFASSGCKRGRSNYHHPRYRIASAAGIVLLGALVLNHNVSALRIEPARTWSE